ncbi:hypothetical protein OV079_39300 [Nannocystis pusilla]|uniref:Lipoprotein n=1 Tax=Nannocystis pusilla TaxID=889268 RepID=A0A9X3EWD0_9BACT|nr:hypothetical protein [Nannocystis pusilla]MCY1011509.1 hypothetical protein [Nannocystis pusilla]
MQSRIIHRSLVSILVLACTLAGCGDSVGSTDTSTPSETGGGADPVWPGYVVECTPDVSGDQLVCITQDDWDCSARGHYVRESICADLWGGTPADYDGKPQLSGAPFQGVVDCANLPAPAADDPDTEDDESVPEIRDGWFMSGCDDCRACGNQVAGWLNDNMPKDAWNELSWCPAKNGLNDYEVLEQWCEGGTDPTGGPEEPPSTGIWICNGSPTICGVMTDTFPPTTEQERCMPPGLVPDCVTADSEQTAANSCYELCVFKNQGHQTEADNSETKIWSPTFPCGDLYNFTPTEATHPLTMCSGSGPMWLEDPLSFAASAELTIGGGSASTNELNGVLDFSLAACPPGVLVCDVSLNDIRAGSAEVHGLYTTRDANGATTSVPFAVSDLEVRLLQPVLGELNQRTGLVTFSDADLFATVSTGGVTLDGMPLSAGVDGAVVVVDGARGTWNGQQLQLDLNWSSQGMSLWLRITGS